MGMEVVLNGPGGGRDSTVMGWKGFNTNLGNGGGVGGSRYHTGIPNVKFGKFRVAIIGLLMMSNGGKRKEIVWIGKEPQ